MISGIQGSFPFQKTFICLVSSPTKRLKVKTEESLQSLEFPHALIKDLLTFTKY